MHMNEQPKTDEPTTVREPSAEYKNFEALLQKVVSVPKSEIDARLKAEKEAKQKK